MLCVSIIFCLIVGSLAGSSEHRPCGLNVTVEKFDLIDFSGIWYTHASTKNGHDPKQKKTILDWNKPNEKNESKAIVTSVSTDTGDLLKMESILTINDKTKALLTSSSVPILGKLDIEVYTIANDPKDFSVALQCSLTDPLKPEAIIAFTRDQNPSERVLKKIDRALAKAGLRLSDLIVHDQGNRD